MKRTGKVLPLLLVMAAAVAFLATRGAVGTEDSRQSPLYESTLRQAYSEMRTVRMEVDVETEPEESVPVILTKPTRNPGQNTVCPKEPDPTKCPHKETKCPVRRTKCPEEVDPTKCPRDKTKCPVVHTVCPDRPVRTECPWEQTICPKRREYTKCEVTHHPEAPTKCDRVTMGDCKAKTWCEPKKGGVTSCPKEATRCFKKKTWCPKVPTTCPPRMTKCPVIVTVCPLEPEPTKCPYEDTRCPKEPEPTKCPTNPTKCPEKYTECPAEPTFCPPGEPTECPVYTKCDVTHRPDAPTECNYAPTICKAVTWCPAVPGECPPEEGDGRSRDAGSVRRAQGVALSSMSRMGVHGPALFQSHPNPFATEAAITYIIPTTTHVTIRLYDMTGRFVRTLVDAERTGGVYTTTLDGTGLDNGVYFYRMIADGRVFAAKATLVR